MTAAGNDSKHWPKEACNTGHKMPAEKIRKAAREETGGLTILLLLEHERPRPSRKRPVTQPGQKESQMRRPECGVSQMLNGLSATAKDPSRQRMQGQA